MREVDPQGAEKRRPCGFAGFQLVVPIVRAGEKALDNADDAGAPSRASTLHSFANGGEPWKPSDWAIHFRGGSQAVTGQRISMPGPKFIFTATGFPSRTSNSAGTIQDEIPGPVAMACQTSSGVPGTSTSTWTDRRPEASFFTLMTAPWMRKFW